MTHAIPEPLPSALLDHHAVDVERKNAGGLGMNVNDVATAPSGEIYALYNVSRYTYGVAWDEADPAKANFGYALLTRHAPDCTLLATAVSGQNDLVRQETAFGGPETGLGRGLVGSQGAVRPARQDTRGHRTGRPDPSDRRRPHGGDRAPRCGPQPRRRWPGQPVCHLDQHDSRRPPAVHDRRVRGLQLRQPDRQHRGDHQPAPHCDLKTDTAGPGLHGGSTRQAHRSRPAAGPPARRQAVPRDHAVAPPRRRDSARSLLDPGRARPAVPTRTLE